MNSPLKQNTTTIQELLNTINSLPEAGTELPELSNEGSASDMLSGKQLIDGDGNIVTGTIATKTASNLTTSGATVTVPAGYYASQTTKSVATAPQVTPSVSVNSSGLITATATQIAGYVSAGTKTATKQLTTQAAKTITPTKSSQTAVNKDVYTTGAVTVAAIPNEYITTSDATASADEIMSGETAYVNGNKVTGTFSIDDELTTQDNLITQIVSTLQNKASATPTLQTKTVTPTTAIQNVTPDSGYDGLSKVTVNAMPTATQATPTVSIDSAGKITASATQTAGYVSAGTKTGTKQLTTQAAKTITPSTSSQTAVASGRYTTGVVTVAGDVNLKAENIAEGVSIFGVTGTHSGGSGGGSSMDTCNLLIDCVNMNQIHMVAITIENRVETIYTKLNNIDSNNEYPPYTINNVKCGSIIVLNVIGCKYSDDMVNIDSGGILIASCKSSSNDNDGHWTNMYIFKAPTTANVDCNILIDA